MSVVKQYTKYGPRYIIVDKISKDIFGTVSYSGGKNTYVLVPPEDNITHPKKPEWNFSPRLKSTYRTCDPGLREEYDDNINEFLNPRGHRTQKTKKPKMYIVHDEVHKNFHSNNPYAENNLNAKVQNHILTKGQMAAVDVRHLYEKGLIKHNGKIFFDPRIEINDPIFSSLELKKSLVPHLPAVELKKSHVPHLPPSELIRSHVPHLPPVKHKKRHVPHSSPLERHFVIDSKITPPGSAGKYYPTHDKPWRAQAKVETYWESKRKYDEYTKKQKAAIRTAEQTFRYWESRLYSPQDPVHSPEASNGNKGRPKKTNSTKASSPKVEPSTRESPDVGGYSSSSGNSSTIPGSYSTSTNSNRRSKNLSTKTSANVSKNQNSRMSVSTRGTKDTNKKKDYVVKGKDTVNSIYAKGPRLRSPKKEK